MLKSSYPFYLANEAVYANTDLSVHNKYSHEVATKVAMASAADIDQAIAAADAAKDAMKALPAYQRQAILQHCITRFKERFDELAYALCIEAGKPIKDSRGEVTRLIDTFQIAAEEATRIYGEVMPMDISARAANYQGMWKRVPIGPCSFISPFNFPLNLAAHKIAPAIAAGCPFVLKPASLTPVSALIVGEILAETELPKGAFSILPCHREGADLFTTDERLKLLSFTGSPDVGWALKAKAGKKPVVLELGGNAACIVDEGTNLDDAVQRIVFGAYYQSGQSCISVQRIIVHEAIYDDMKRRLTEAVSALVSGDPLDENTFIGPMISEKEAQRLQTWIEEAVAGGAKVLAGGQRDGAMLMATLMENVDPAMSVSCQEVFGPVAILSSFRDFDAALAEVNHSVFGLQAGIFTKDIYKAYKAWDVLDVGGVVIGDVPSWRVDHMPYGGVKDSGLGREGVRFAIEDMTEMKLMVLRDIS
ncbi:aldehyde dehydrogenase family protein [Vibrio rhizosphaerae]|uniref:Aldehyde dehydrogenase family protein n=1 Tax=Vibrio rhizosphaerae TaxID=398736 RepID=A0ABU4IZS0_9VIBR|nr:aldehyde dehydrogenase family protein [Vibrio rhizosphaerae]MDW6093754.1 aldehyde dehydrogenase family protein [Vibrio rhizosphaerae]